MISRFGIQLIILFIKTIYIVECWELTVVCLSDQTDFTLHQNLKN